MQNLAAPSRRTLILASPLVALLLGGCDPSPRTVRYRLTLAVQTPEGERVGSSVVETKETYSTQPALGGTYVSLTGEATVVDLSPRGVLFCAMAWDPKRPPNPAPMRLNMPASAFYGRYDKAERITKLGQLLDALNRDKPQTDLPLYSVPMLVRFRDLNDSASVERVDPDDLAAAFGPGVRLVRATVAITDDPVTEGIERWLPWLKGRGPSAHVADWWLGRTADEIPPEALLTYNKFRSSGT